MTLSETISDTEIAFNGDDPREIRDAAYSRLSAQQSLLVGVLPWVLLAGVVVGFAIGYSIR